MKNIATRGLFAAAAAAALLGGLSAAPSPTIACNIANPPIACVNLPGSNPVSGLGTLFQNQFQPVAGAGPGFQDRGGAFQGDGRGDNNFYFADDIWQLNDRWTFGTPSAAPGENAEPQSFSTDEARKTAQERRVNAELNDIVKDYNSGSTGTDPEFDRQILLLAIELMRKDSAGLEIERQIASDLENAERHRETPNPNGPLLGKSRRFARRRAVRVPGPRLSGRLARATQAAVLCCAATTQMSSVRRDP